jgi:hypothetical protein
VPSNWYDGLDMPDQGAAWLRVPQDGRAIRVVACGNPGSWRCHFVRVRERGRVYGARCLAREEGTCRLCDLGNAARVRYVLPVWYRGYLHYVEVGRPQWADLLHTGVDGWWSRPILLWRERPGPTGRIRLAPDTTAALDDTVPRVDVSAFVADLGRSALQCVLAALERDRLAVVPGECPRPQPLVVVHGNGHGNGNGHGLRRSNTVPEPTRRLP